MFEWVPHHIESAEKYFDSVDAYNQTHDDGAVMCLGYYSICYFGNCLTAVSSPKDFTACLTIRHDPSGCADEETELFSGSFIGCLEFCNDHKIRVDTRELLDVCLFAFNHLPNTPINDGDGTTTYDVAAEIKALLGRMG